MNKASKTNKTFAKIFKPGIFLLIYPLILFCNPVWAENRFKQAGVLNTKEQFNQNELKKAEELELISGKSFVLEIDTDIERIAVGNPKVADIKAISPRQILINPRAPGTTNLIIWHKELNSALIPPKIYNLTVNIDISEIEKKLKDIVPEANISIKAAGGNLLVQGDCETHEIMDKVIMVISSFVPQPAIKNLMQLKSGQQVQLDVKIAEVSRSEIKRIGLNWLSNRSFSGHQTGVGLFQSGSAGGTLGGQGVSGQVVGQSSSGTPYYENSGGILSSNVSIASTFSDAFQIAISVLDKDFLSIISLLKSQGLARILAKPTLVAMSGQKATFMVGGEFPVPIDAGEGSVGIDYKKYGITLEFTPVVTGTETINLNVLTGVSDIDYSTTVASGGVMVPGVSNRGVGTSLRLKDGQSFAIAGMLKENINSVINKIPILGDIPILGVLFRSKEYIKEETELVILVTAHLVKPLNRPEVPALPGEKEDYTLGDFDFLFTAKSGGEKNLEIKNSANENKPGFTGAVGFEN